MKKISYILLAYVMFFLPAYAQQPSADLILLNGKVFTSDAAMPKAEAIAIRGERILAVGSNEEIKKLADAKTRSIDLSGRTVTPGINDAHTHFGPKPAGFELKFGDMEPSWTEVIEAVKNAVKEAPKGTWFSEVLAVRQWLTRTLTVTRWTEYPPNIQFFLKLTTDTGKSLIQKRCHCLGFLKRKRMHSAGILSATGRQNESTEEFLNMRSGGRTEPLRKWFPMKMQLMN